MPPPLPRPTPRGDLLAAGRTDAEIRTDLHAGRLVRLAPGTYLDAGTLAGLDIDDRERVRIRAAAERSPGLVVSHRSAAVIRGLPVVTSSQTVHFTRPGDGGGRRTTTRHVHASRLPDEATTTVDGLVVTSVARTLLDVGRTESLGEAVVVADAALHRGLVDGSALAQVLDENPAITGRPRAARALRLADGRSESPGETLTRLALRSSGMPPLELQPEIFDDRGIFIGRPDFAIPDCGVLLEFDGRTKYTSLLRPGQSVSDVVLAEKRREERLTELGWLVIRVVWADLADDRSLCHRVLGACRSRRRLVEASGVRGSIRRMPPISW